MSTDTLVLKISMANETDGLTMRYDRWDLSALAKLVHREHMVQCKSEFLSTAPATTERCCDVTRIPPQDLSNDSVLRE